MPISLRPRVHAALERTEKVVNEVQCIASALEGVNSVSSLAGFSVLSDGTGAVYGMNLISLKNWKQRKKCVATNYRIRE